MALATAASTAYGVGKTIGIDFGDITGGIGDIFGISGRAECTAEDKANRDKIEQAIKQLLSPGEMQSLVNMADSNIRATPSDMANFFVGGVSKWGGDCKHKNVSSGDQRFLNQLESKIKQKQREAQQQAQQSSGNGSSGVTDGPTPSLSFQKNTLLGLLAVGVLITIYAIRNG